ncbi:Ap4A phosphorylase-like protein II [Dothidotthia symphoricarpi CBS 119687]|uniref:Ap4A phosphorylase-like protein II n=1 Tax=Dothidotthia symphoricarpi CBS 119687 TaxID=1392245 RepID=A0A6A6ANL8_9PLEO|nr:Ap4A phosphorylase-like protein II [Dothidotthia symphoricarpi CBS 119687]KAF2132081.1 Ap4A phosphorylase-like protein II [Dothidotthia symphoricarpi CBS 119687]
MSMLLGLSESLPSLVDAKFKSAKATSSLLFSPTELAIIRTSTGIPFQLRYCPSLAKKPTPKHDATPKKQFDPFADPPPALHLVDIPTTNPSHILVLNKFPVIAGHFILATKSNKQQTHALEQDDLEATYACLKAWHEGSNQKRLFAFFNSGDHSGASQPHRHLQFLPLEGMRDGEVAAGWELLIDRILEDDSGSGLLQHSALPFSHFARKFAAEPSGAQLLDVYNELYHAAKEVVDDFIRANPDQLALTSTNQSELPISYNLAMTMSGMVILPRRSEGAMLRRQDGSEIGFVALNGTTLGGTMMVKHEEEWDALRSQPEKLDSILAAIGIPREPLPLKPRV